MQKELADSLRHIQTHATTGTPHNQQLISTQVETIFVLDEVKEEMVKLRGTIVSLDRQNSKLTKATVLLGIAAVLLAVVQAAAAVITLFVH